MLEFNSYEISLFNSVYFSSFSLKGNMIEVQSKSTGHWWILKVIEPQVIRLYHKHKQADYYHLQCCVSKAKEGLKVIRTHDNYVIRTKGSVPSALA